MRNIDEKFKDASPVDTVNTIKNILAANGLSVTEDWFDSNVNNCYSLRVTIDGTKFGTNGKGVTRALANASAHAELMERLQSGIMGRDCLSFKDAVMMSRAELVENCRDFFVRICGVAKSAHKISLTPENLADTCVDYCGGKEQCSALPFYSVTDDKITYVPECLLMPLFSSTGNCAGNTAEEAIVQGISEIVERWFQRHFLCCDVVPPTIPDEYLQKFQRAYDTITEIRSKGYDVIVKDCSMATGYPVIATAFIDKRKHTYHVHMGASPIFEIALGRSLTETFQGREIASVADTKLTESAKNDIKTYRKSYTVGRGAYPIDFFTENSSYDFVPFQDRTGLSNTDLMRYAVDFIRKRDMHIYIRDMSHLGFCSYKIIVPDMCKADFDFITSDLPIARLTGDTLEAELDLENATDDQLFELQLLNLYKLNNYLVDSDPRCQKLMLLPITEDGFMDRAAGYAHLAYIEWQCGNRKAAMVHAESVQNQNVVGISDFCSCLIRSKAMIKDGSDLQDVFAKLKVFYDDSTVQDVAETISNDTNPFRKYVVRCSRENGCDDCFYRTGCKVQAEKDLISLVNKYVYCFDNEQAFAKIKMLFKNE